MCSEKVSQGGLRDEEIGVLHEDHSAGGADSRTGHDTVEVRMEVQALAPGMEHRGEAAHFNCPDKPRTALQLRRFAGLNREFLATVGAGCSQQPSEVNQESAVGRRF
jgi:hypothetical protein